jgi:FkbM family methyltransferase
VVVAESHRASLSCPSDNGKTGTIAVSSTSRHSCTSSCRRAGDQGCNAEARLKMCAHRLVWRCIIVLHANLSGEMKALIKNKLKQIAPSWISKRSLDRELEIAIKKSIESSGYNFSFSDKHIDIIDGLRVVRISRAHAIYVNDIIGSFDFFYSAVSPVQTGGYSIVDYSKPRYHNVRGFDLFPVMMPSLCEPMETNNQYLDVAKLAEGMTAFDLGAYSGLTSIIFAETVGESGRVVAVEADLLNLQCIHKNIESYAKLKKSCITIIEGAVWKDSQGIEFSDEGNMGSSAVSIVGPSRGKTRMVKTYTLNDVARMAGVDRVDFIKCDIEGAEYYIFEDKDFFSKFRPRILVESHFYNGEFTSDKVISTLEAHGYQCEQIEQLGMQYPLLLFNPQ